MRHSSEERQQAHEHHLTVPRTARYYTCGAIGPATRDLWIACHGYGQLAAEFAERLGVLGSAERVVVAPEGLSRFYLERARGGSHATSPVGASWMTREDRAAEIADQVAYLDTIAETFKGGTSHPLQLTALGFSQGVATICRWLAHSRTRAARLVCWGGMIPDDVLSGDLRAFRSTRIWLIAGSRDEFVSAERFANGVAAARGAGLDVGEMRFEGGHRLDDATLMRLAVSELAVSQNPPGTGARGSGEHTTRLVTPDGGKGVTPDRRAE